MQRVGERVDVDVTLFGERVEDEGDAIPTRTLPRQVE
jgi:hypothetical protein